MEQHRHSNDRRVVLRGLTLKSRGLYRCEVLAEAPNFETISGENMLEVICKYTIFLFFFLSFV